MLDKMISTQVFEQPDLGKLVFAQAEKEVAKREKVGGDLDKSAAAAAAVRGFMPAKHTQASEAYLGAMKSAYVKYRKSGSEADLQNYTDYKNKLLSTMAVGKARYDSAASARQKAYQDGFEGVLGGKEVVDGQWSAVMEEGFESISFDKNGNLVVAEKGQVLPWNATPYSDIKNINAGVSDYILERETSVPKLAIPSEASANYRNLLNIETDDTWEDVSSRLYGQMEIDKDSREYREAAAIYYYRDVLGRAADNRQLSPVEKRAAIEKYANNDRGFRTAWSAYTSDIARRLEKEYGRNPDDEGGYSGLGAYDKDILDRPLNMYKREQMMLPSGETADIDLYSMDLKALNVSYDKAEGQTVKEVYFNSDGTLNHFSISVPAEKFKDGSIDSIFELEDITVDGKAIDSKGLSQSERIAEWGKTIDRKAAPKKNIIIRVYDPRELGNTFGTQVAGFLREKVLRETGNQAYRAIEADKGYGSTVAEDMPMTD